MSSSEYSPLSSSSTSNISLQEQEEVLSKLIEPFRDCIVLHDLNGKVIEVNEAAVETFGYSESDFLELHISQLQPNTKRGGDKAPVALEIFNDSKVDITRTVFVKKNNARFPADVKTSYVRFKRDDEYLTVVQRVFRNSEADITRSASMLKRPSGLSPQMSEEMDFLSVINRELKSPLREIISALRILSEAHFDQEQHALLSYTQKSSSHLIDIMNDIVDFFRLTSGKIEIHRHNFDLVALVSDVVEKNYPQANRRGIDIGTYIDPRIPQLVNSDESRVRQILNKLVTNAIRLTEDGSIQLEAHLTLDGRVRFQVIDSGAGITIEEQEALFKEDIMEAVSVSERYCDIALGFSLARKLVASLDGESGFCSLPGQGSLFWFSISMGNWEHAESFGVPEKFLKEKLVYLIDSFDVSKDEFEKQFKAWGANVKAFGIEKDAIYEFSKGRVKEAKPDVIVLNVHREDSGHAALVREINAYLQEANNALETEFVVITPETLDPRAARLFSRVKHTHIFRPLRIGLFANKMASLLGVEKPYDVEKCLEDMDGSLPSCNKKHDGRILLVEGSNVSQITVAALLRNKGFEVDLACTGAEALQAVNKEYYDVILMDVQLSQVEGVDTAMKIREREVEGSKTPIIAMTTVMEDELWRKCLYAGMDDYMTKPLDIQVMIPSILYWMGTGEVSDPFNIGKNRVDSQESESKQEDVVDALSLRIRAGDAIDFSTLKQLERDTNRETVNEMVDLFLNEVSEQVLRFKSKAESGDFGAIALEAQSMVNSCTIFGITWLKRLANELLVESKENNNEQCRKLIDILPDVYADCAKLLKVNRSN